MEGARGTITCASWGSEPTLRSLAAPDPTGARLSPSYPLTSRYALHLVRSLLITAFMVSAGCGSTLAPVRSNHLLEPETTGVRNVRLRLVLDTLWVGGESYAHDIVEHASKNWEESFGIRFVVSTTTERSVAGLTAMDQIENLARLVELDEESDVVVLFTRSTGLLWPEAAELLGNYVVVAPGLWDSPVNMLNHGLGHIFGAGHSRSPAHVMSFLAVPFVSRPEIVSFSKRTSETIVANKWRSFDRSHALRQARGPEKRRGKRR